MIVNKYPKFTFISSIYFNLYPLVKTLALGMPSVLAIQTLTLLTASDTSPKAVTVVFLH